MTPVFAARRRAEEFNSLVEDASTGRKDARYAEFLEIVGSLRELPTPQPRPEFVASLREQLMSAADTLLVPAEEERLTLPSRRPTRDRRIAAAVGGFALVGATTSMALAAQSALPGDALYPLKRAIENAEAGLSVDEGEKGVTLLDNATGRLAEVSALTSEGDLEDSTAIAETLTSFTEQTTEASDLLLTDYVHTGDESSITELRDFTATSMETLAELEALIPDDARDELLHAARVLTRIDLAASRACPSCAGAGITEIPAILTSAGFTSSVTAVETTRAKDDEQTTAEQPAEETVLPDPGEILSPGSVLNPPTESDPPEDDGGGKTDEPADDPIGDLTSGLTGDGDQPTANDPQLPGVPEVEEELEEITEDLTGTLP